MYMYMYLTVCIMYGYIIVQYLMCRLLIINACRPIIFTCAGLYTVGLSVIVNACRPTCRPYVCFNGDIRCVG